MKQLLKLNMLGNAGLNSDVLPFELPPEFINTGVNFRVRNGFIQPFYGSVDVLQTPGAAYTGFLKHVRIKQGDYWVIGARENIWINFANGQPWLNISTKGYSLPTGGEHDWTGTQLGQLLIMNNVNSFPEYWANETLQDKLLGLPFKPNPAAPGDLSTAITWEQQGLRCRSMRAHKNFLIAMNLSGVEDLPNGYRISHPANTNAIPFTWDTTDRSSIAIQAQLGGDGGEIVDGRTLRDSFVMYSRDSIDVLNYNANSEYYWQRKELSSTVGLLTTNCLSEVKGTHFLIVDGDIVSNDGSNITSLLYKKLLRRFNSRTNEYTKLNSFVARNDIAHEVWFCVPEEGSVTASMAYIYNWKDQSWSLSELPKNTVHMDYGANPAQEDLQQADTWRHIDPNPSIPQVPWASISRPWGSRKLTALDDILAATNTIGVIYEVDPKDGIQEPAFNMSIERSDIPILDHRGNVSITRVYPTATGDPFLLQIGTQQFAGGPIDWYAETKFDPGQERYIDLRNTGELLCYRIRSIGKNRFKFSGMEIEIVAAGQR